MVASTVELPNIRKMFIPDPDYTIFEVDLERADAQVVAAEAGDHELRRIFRDGIDIHTENAQFIFETEKITKDQRHKSKQGVHAVDYGVKGRTLAVHLGTTVAVAEKFINYWLSNHPGIREWHRRTQFDLRTTHSVSNKFGFRRYYFDRSQNLLPKALAWIPQSTVALVTYKGMLNIKKNVPEVQQLLQVHDSIVGQIRTEIFDEVFPRVIENVLIPIPYEDPLIIPVTAKASTKSWGDCEEVKLAA